MDGSAPISGQLGVQSSVARILSYRRRLMSEGEKLIYAPRAVVFHPIPEQRLTKRYFESWYFDYGRMLVRTSSPPRTTKSYFGIPRYMLLKLVMSIGRWATSFGPKRRFYHRLQVWLTIGEITESRCAFKNGSILAKSLKT